MTLPSFTNTSIITGQFSQVKVPLHEFVDDYSVIPLLINLKHFYITGPIYYNRNNLGLLPALLREITTSGSFDNHPDYSLI